MSERPNSRRDQSASSSSTNPGNEPGDRAGARRNVSAQPPARPSNNTFFGSVAATDPGGRPAVRPTHFQPAAR